MSIGNNESGKCLATNNFELYKELETINFKELSKALEKEKGINTLSGIHIKKRKSKVTPLRDPMKRQPRTQIELFHKSMKILLIYGQCIGLNPVTNITSEDYSEMRFTPCSLRFVYSCVMCASQVVFTAFCVQRLMRNYVSISMLAFISFYFATVMTTIVFIQMASNWSSLMKKIVNSSLDKYIDVTVQRRCYITTMIMLALAICENLLSQNTKIMNVIYCSADNVSIYETFIEVSFPWFKELNWTVPIPAGILLLFFNVTATLNWSYSDIFIICISLYLASILKKINETMAQVDLRFYHPTFWSNIREDYTRATQLIATFDDNISGLMLISFASNLFFICLQLFHILSHGLQEKTGNKADPCVANEKVYSYLMYFLFSLTFVLGRFLAVSMVAASVNTASKAPGPILYGVPAHAYCNEVQRFIEQVHGGNVALSGLQFFYVTKGLVLTVAGTIVTYELVLLQFNGEDANS